MASKNDAKVRKAMQNHVLSFFKGRGGRTELIEYIKSDMDQQYRHGENPSPYTAGYNLAEGMVFGDMKDIQAIITRLGLLTPRTIYIECKATAEERHREWSKERPRGKGPFLMDIYDDLCGRACRDIYKEYVEKHPSERWKPIPGRR